LPWSQWYSCAIMVATAPLFTAYPPILYQDKPEAAGRDRD
jgi:hypothetical protein